MTLEAKKLDLINWLTSLKDNAVISQLYAIKNDNESDWHNQLTDDQKKEIEIGLNDLDNGRTIRHEDVTQAVRQKIEQLKK